MKAMKVKKTLQITLGALHLLLVGFSATYCYLDEKISGSRLVDFYGKLSGADSSYGFFAPSIGSRVRGTFDLIAADGSTTATISLEHEQGREADIRMGGVFDEFTSQSGLDEKFRQTLATSLAARVFGKYPETTQVVFHLEEYRPMSMPEYRQGTRSRWEEIYRARFARNETAANTVNKEQAP